MIVRAVISQPVRRCCTAHSPSMVRKQQHRIAPRVSCIPRRACIIQKDERPAACFDHFDGRREIDLDASLEVRPCLIFVALK